MRTIFAAPDPGEHTGPFDDPAFGWVYPNRCEPDQVVLPDGSIICSDWCARGDDHPEATDQTEQVCRSHQIRITPAAGGGRTGHTRPADCHCDSRADCPAIGWADAQVILLAEQFPGEPSAIVLATEVAGVEQHITLTIEETDRLTTALHTLGFRIEGVPG